jgi:Skp family chaperone for outer membrane proteins
LSFFETDPFTLPEKSNFGGTALGNQFVGENPSSNAKISYLLTKRHTFGKMTGEITTLDGALVSKIEVGKNKGINTIEWGFNANAPKVAKGKGFSVAPPPYVKAGNYLVKITKGNETFEKQIEVIYDSTSSITSSERAQQQQTTREIFDMIQDLAYLVYQIDQWDAIATEYKTKHTKADKNLDALRMDLTAMRNTLVVTTGDNYVGAAEDELREKLNEIFANVSSYFGAPSTSELANIKALSNELNNAKKQFGVIQEKRIKALKSLLEKDTAIKMPEILSFEEFLKQ